MVKGNNSDRFTAPFRGKPEQAAIRNYFNSRY